MAVPGSGTLSLLGIRRELGDDNYSASTNYTNISLKDCSDGTIDTINTQNNASFRPLQGDDGDAMSEFYGYDHDLANLYTMPNITQYWDTENVDGPDTGCHISTDSGATEVIFEIANMNPNGDEASSAGWVYKTNTTGTVETPTISDNDGNISDTADFQTAGGESLPTATLSTTIFNNVGRSLQNQNRRYYVRAYATNSAGTAYSAVHTFYPSYKPCITTDAVTSIGSTGFTMNANIIGTGNRTMDKKGFVYSSTNTSPHPGGSGVTNRVITTGLNAPGTYSLAVTGLSSSTTYYIRAYAERPNGGVDDRGFGDVVTATTSAALSAPSLTIAVSGIVLWNQFTIAGAITSTGGASITAHGIVASKTTTSPTIGGTGVLQFADTSISQTSFTSNANSGVLGTQTWYVRGYATNSVGTTYTSAITVNTPRRPLSVKYNFTKFGISSVCTETQTMTIFNETNNTFNTMVQTGDPIYVSADPTDNDQNFGALAHWFSDGNRKRRWGTTSWTSAQTTC